MKKLTTIIALSVALFSTSVFASPTCSKEDTIFFGYNLKHTKAVELCKVPEGYRYTFGPVGKPELTLLRSKVQFGGGGMGGGFTIPNGAFEYAVGEDKFEGGFLSVSKNGKELAVIKLDDADKSFYNNTSVLLDQ